MTARTRSTSSPLVPLPRRADDRRRSESAEHYLGLPADSLRSLRTTIVLAARSLGFPAGLLTVVDGTTVHALTGTGTDPWGSAPRELALCDLVTTRDEPVLLGGQADVPESRRSAMGPWEAYLGVPVHGREGHTVGALCLVDTRARTLTQGQADQLAEFAAIVEDQLDLARRRHEAALTGAVDSHALSVALDRGEVLPWYQPVVDLRSGDVVGLEALARWEHPEHGVITPESFVPVAEDSDLVLELDLAVLRRALADLAGWRAGAFPDLRVNVNLSSKHLRSARGADALLGAAEAAGVPATAVGLEITETAAMATDLHSVARLQRLREAGFQVLLDDFGTGFSTLEHLIRLPVDGIKIDKSLTQMLGSPRADALVRALTGMCRETGLASVVEGVESARAASRARQLGATTAQGYLWSPAVPARRVPAVLASTTVAATG